MKIVVIGGGSTGIVYGGFLSQVADTTILCRREEQADAINTSGVVVQRAGKDESYSPNATTSRDVLEHADYAIVLTKCYDAPTVAHTLQEYGPKIQLVCLHNGLGTLDIYNEAIGKDNVIAGVTYLGSERLSDTKTTLGLKVRTVIGEQNDTVTDRVTALVEVLDSAGFQAEASDSVLTSIWKKLVLNVAQNALAALTNSTYGEMGTSSHTISIAQRTLDELAPVAAASGITLSDDDLMPALMRNWTEGHLDQYPSMWQDVKNKRKTEIDYINGAISTLGNQYDIDTPFNDLTTLLIKTIEEKYL